MVHTWRVSPPAAFRILLTATLAVCIAIFVFRTIRWPLLGDASLIHYVIFLADRGASPYRDIAEINMPGSYFIEWIVIHFLGGGQMAWRIFDLLLMGSAIMAMVVITLPLDWFAGFWAGSLFLLVHGRDGILELGQRDLTLSVCLLAGYAFLFLAVRRDRPPLILVFGLLAGLAATIKPTFLLLGPLSLLLACVDLRRKERAFQRFAFYGASGWLVPWAAVALFLWREDAIKPFVTTTRGMVLYHAGLARRPIVYLLVHSVAPLLPLVLAWLAIVVLRRRQPTEERLHLWIGLGFGLFSYLSQAKGYSYQRYPLLAFLLALMSMDFVAELHRRGVTRALGIAGLALGGLFLVPVSTAMAVDYDWKDLGTVGMLEKDLEGLGPAELAGGVQCVDSIAGCTNVLYRMKLDEPSYVLYDEFLFGSDSVWAVEQNREKFWRDIQRSPPEVIVVTERLFPSGPDDYQKLSRWPQFHAYLEEQYSLYIQRKPDHALRWWSRSEIPAGYRIYLRKSVDAKPDLPTGTEDRRDAGGPRAFGVNLPCRSGIQTEV